MTHYATQTLGIESSRWCHDNPEIEAIGNYSNYLWSTGNSNSSISITEEGWYSIQVEDENGCVQEDSIFMQMEEPISPALINVTHPTRCDGEDGSIEIENVLGIEYSIDGGTIFSKSPIFSNLEEGAYEILFRPEEGGNACVTTEPINVTIVSPDLPQIRELSFNSLTNCNQPDGNILIEVTDSSSSFQYSIDGGFSWQEENQFSELDTGTYQVMVRDVVSECESVIQEISIQGDTGIDLLDVSLRHPICVGDDSGQVALTFSREINPEQVAWDNGAQGLEIDNLSPGIYTYTITSITGCIEEGEIEIIEPEPIEYSDQFSEQEIICTGDSLRLSSSINEAYTYTWITPSGESIEGGSIEILEGGSYRLLVENSDGCSVIEQVQVTIINEDFTGIDFLASSEGVINDPITIVNTSFPLRGNTSWIIPEDVEVIENREQGLVLSFPEAGKYEIGQFATVGDCNQSRYKEIEIFETIDELSNPENYGKNTGHLLDFKLFPNPNDGEFSVRISLSGRQDMQLMIVDHSGNIVDSRIVTGEKLYLESYNVADLPPGVYAMIVTSGTASRYITFSKM